MEALQEEGIDNLANLEERITRAVQVITSLRNENGQLQQRVKAAEDNLTAVRAELEDPGAHHRISEGERRAGTQGLTTDARSGPHARRTETGEDAH